MKSFKQFVAEEYITEENGTHTYGYNDEVDPDKAVDAYTHVDNVHDHAKSKGYKINHNDGSSKPAHKNPDITFHTDEGDDSPSSYTVHKGGAAAGDKKVNPGTSHDHHLFSGSPD